MSYCVNCGVELAQSEKDCPLCGVEVQNPRSPWKEPADRPYPRRLEPILKRTNRLFFASMASLFLSLPFFMTLFTDFVKNHTITWSGYVAGAIIVVFVFFVVPLFLRRYYLLRLLSLDCAVALAYLKLIEYAARGDWFLTIAMPITVFLSVLILTCAVIIRNRKKISAGVRYASVFFAVGLLTVWIDLVIGHANGLPPIPGWSVYSFFPCVIFAVFLILLSRHTRLREEIRRRLLY